MRTKFLVFLLTTALVLSGTFTSAKDHRRPPLSHETRFGHEKDHTCRHIREDQRSDHCPSGYRDKGFDETLT